MIKKGSVTWWQAILKTVILYRNIRNENLRRFGNEWAEIEIEELLIGLLSASGMRPTSSSIHLG